MGKEMFSENRKISKRQVFRLLTFDLLGLSTLLLPPMLADTAGRDGVFAILLGTLFGLLFLKLLSHVIQDMGENTFAEYLRKSCGGVFGWLIQIGYFIYLILLAGYTAYLFCAVVLRNLLREETFYLVLFVILALAAYGLISGIEGRARVYELLFCFLLVPLFLMLIAAWDEVDTDYWTPIMAADWGEFFAGSYGVFSCFSLLFLILFIVPYGKKMDQLLSGSRMALLLVAGIHLVLYLVLLGVFGQNALAKMEDAAITLMSTVKISGGFLKRADALMFGIWFFTLYALLNSAIFYSGSLLSDITGLKKRRISYAVVLVIVFISAICFYKDSQMEVYYRQFIYCLGTPFLVLVPFMLWCRRKRTSEKKKVLLCLLCFLPFLTGCASPELEERNFPIEAAVTDTENISAQWLYSSAGGNRVVDYSHLKLLILNQSVVEDERSLEELLDFLKKQNTVPRNTYVAVAEDASLMMEENASGESAGTYFEEWFENVSEVKKQAYPTLGMLYEEQENKQETLFLPYVAREGDQFLLDGYYVMRRAVPAGRCESEAAQLSFFTQNKMHKYQLSLERGFELELFEAENRIRFLGTAEKKTIEVKVRCKGRIAAYPSGKFFSKKEAEQMSEAYFNREASELLQAESPVDITNSYKKIGAEKREWYEYVSAMEKQYEENAQIVYHVEITWINL